jgi:ketosteroid isomerase-like protein
MAMVAMANQETPMPAVSSQLVDALERVYEKKDLRHVSQIFAPDYLEHDPASPAPHRGPENIKQLIKSWQSAFTDLQLAVEERVVEGDTVIIRWCGSGTYACRARGPEPGNTPITLSGTTVTRIARGRAVEGWSNWRWPDGGAPAAWRTEKRRWTPVGEHGGFCAAVRQVAHCLAHGRQ